MSLREVSDAVYSDRIIHRVERVPKALDGTAPWRALCGVPVGKTHAGGSFEFDVAVAIDPEAWRLAANCVACRAVTERRALGTLSQ